MGGCGRETSVATASCFQRRPFILPQAKMGLRIISYTLKEVSDANGYMDSLGVQKIEEVKKIARMGPSNQANTRAPVAFALWSRPSQWQQSALAA